MSVTMRRSKVIEKIREGGVAVSVKLNLDDPRGDGKKRKFNSLPECFHRKIPLFPELYPILPQKSTLYRTPWNISVFNKHVPNRSAFQKI